MADFLAWVSLVLQVYSMWPLWPAGRRKVRRSEGCIEINLGIWRKRVTWTEIDAPR
jgi:hypothetical protein